MLCLKSCSYVKIDLLGDILTKFYIITILFIKTCSNLYSENL